MGCRGVPGGLFVPTLFPCAVFLVVLRIGPPRFGGGQVWGFGVRGAFLPHMRGGAHSASLAGAVL